VTDRTAELKAWLDGRADELATLLEALVRVPTENPPGRELGRCAGVLRDAMERLGFSPELIELAPTGGVIWHACRGAITLRVRTHGREAHVGYVHQGVNAFEHMIRIAQPLTALAHELLEKRTSFAVESEAAGGSMLVVGGQAGAGAGFNAVPGPHGSPSTAASTPKNSSTRSSSD